MCPIFALPHGVPGWAPTVTTNNTTIPDDANTPYEVEAANDLEVVETVEVEREFDGNGNVIREKRTVSRPRIIPRDLPPRTPLRPDNPFRDVGEPNSPYEPYKAPQGPYTQPMKGPHPWTAPNTAPWRQQGPFWTGDPPPYTPGQIWCDTTYTPPQMTYTVAYGLAPK